MIRTIVIIITLLGSCLLSGCTGMKVEEEKILELEYTIVKQEEQPDEIQTLIEMNYETKMKMSYTDQGMEYIIIGYGEQQTSGYSVEIIDVYETENALYVDTNLLGPISGEEIVETVTYPYIVICMEENEKPIIYE